MNRVSVIIPTHNCARYICAAIESVLSQKYPDVEAVVVDDASQDNTISLLHERFASAIQSQQIKIIRNPKNMERSASRNIGAKHAKGGVLMFLDADDVYLPDHAANVMKMFEEQADADAVYVHPSRIIDEKGSVVGRPLPFISPCRFSTDQLITMGSIPCTIGISVRRKAFDSIGGFTAELNQREDWDFGLRLIMHGHRVTSIQADTVCVRYHEGNTSKHRAEFLGATELVFERAWNFSLRRGFGRSFQAAFLLAVAAHHLNRYSIRRGRQFLLGALLRSPLSMLSVRAIKLLVKAILPRQITKAISGERVYSDLSEPCFKVRVPLKELVLQ
ncbi:MAG TPA: glycosyltransferase [Terriglobales bacterium]|nr:glycosyltransferase [Terriglobales bacterium]